MILDARSLMVAFSDAWPRSLAIGADHGGRGSDTRRAHADDAEFAPAATATIHPG